MQPMQVVTERMALDRVLVKVRAREPISGKPDAARQSHGPGISMIAM